MVETTSGSCYDEFLIQSNDTLNLIVISIPLLDKVSLEIQFDNFSNIRMLTFGYNDYKIEIDAQKIRDDKSVVTGLLLSSPLGSFELLKGKSDKGEANNLFWKQLYLILNNILGNTPKYTNITQNALLSEIPDIFNFICHAIGNEELTTFINDFLDFENYYLTFMRHLLCANNTDDSTRVFYEYPPNNSSILDVTKEISNTLSTTNNLRCESCEKSYYIQFDITEMPDEKSKTSVLIGNGPIMLQIISEAEHFNISIEKSKDKGYQLIINDAKINLNPQWVKTYVSKLYKNPNFLVILNHVLAGFINGNTEDRAILLKHIISSIPYDIRNEFFPQNTLIDLYYQMRNLPELPLEDALSKLVEDIKIMVNQHMAKELTVAKLVDALGVIKSLEEMINIITEDETVRFNINGVEFLLKFSGECLQSIIIDNYNAYSKIMFSFGSDVQSIEYSFLSNEDLHEISINIQNNNAVCAYKTIDKTATTEYPNISENMAWNTLLSQKLIPHIALALKIVAVAREIDPFQLFGIIINLFPEQYVKAFFAGEVLIPQENEKGLVLS